MIGPIDPVGGPAGQQAARTELRRPEYRHDGPSVLERVAQWLGRRVDDLFSGGTGSDALLVVLVLVLAAGVVFAARAGGTARRARTEGTDADPLAPDEEVDHRARALRFAAENRRAEALREWLRDAVRTVEQRGVLAPRPGRTGTATAREAGPLLAPAVAAELGAATAAFDEVWFGGRPATDADVGHGRAAAEGVATARILVANAPPDGLAVPW